MKSIRELARRKRSADARSPNFCLSFAVERVQYVRKMKQKKFRSYCVLVAFFLFFFFCVLVAPLLFRRRHIGTVTLAAPENTRSVPQSQFFSANKWQRDQKNLTCLQQKVFFRPRGKMEITSQAQNKSEQWIFSLKMASEENGRTVDF